jgi:hypothetical protein
MPSLIHRLPFPPARMNWSIGPVAAPSEAVTDYGEAPRNRARLDFFLIEIRTARASPDSFPAEWVVVSADGIRICRPGVPELFRPRAALVRGFPRLERGWGHTGNNTARNRLHPLWEASSDRLGGPLRKRTCNPHSGSPRELALGREFG